MALLAGFILLVSVIGSALAWTQRSTTNTDPRTSGSNTTIFLVPNEIPAGLELSTAELWSDGITTTQTYRPAAYVEGAPTVTITVSDMVKVLDSLGVDAYFPTTDPARFFSELRQGLVDTYRELDPDARISTDSITIRGQPALNTQIITTVDGITEAQIGVIVLEGDGIVTEINTSNVTENVAIAVAESLRPITSEAFLELTNPR